MVFSLADGTDFVRVVHSVNIPVFWRVAMRGCEVVFSLAGGTDFARVVLSVNGAVVW